MAEKRISFKFGEIDRSRFTLSVNEIEIPGRMITINGEIDFHQEERFFVISYEMGGSQGVKRLELKKMMISSQTKLVSILLPRMASIVSTETPGCIVIHPSILNLFVDPENIFVGFKLEKLKEQLTKLGFDLGSIFVDLSVERGGLKNWEIGAQRFLGVKKFVCSDSISVDDRKLASNAYFSRLIHEEQQIQV